MNAWKSFVILLIADKLIRRYYIARELTNDGFLLLSIHNLKGRFNVLII